ncbi:MAG: hypothetical protein KJ822_08310 [Proteobacteria bacterium]|nr:hypothetical protein [Pseudomonadota bacterium]MBU4355339.1 hypothetical protein [Pseudomonadota bacterium]
MPILEHIDIPLYIGLSANFSLNMGIDLGEVVFVAYKENPLFTVFGAFSRKIVQKKYIFSKNRFCYLAIKFNLN